MSKDMKLIMERFEKAMSEQMPAVGMPLKMGVATKMGNEEYLSKRKQAQFQTFAKNAALNMRTLAKEIEKRSFAGTDLPATGKDERCDMIAIEIEPGDIDLWPKEEFGRKEGAAVAQQVLSVLQSKYSDTMDPGNINALQTRFMISQNKVSEDYTYYCIVTKAQEKNVPGETKVDPCVLRDAIRHVADMLDNGKFTVQVDAPDPDAGMPVP